MTKEITPCKHCDRPARVKGVCDAHYRRMRRNNGDPQADVPLKPRAENQTSKVWIDNLLQQWDSKQIQPGTCLIWPYGRHTRGYPLFWKDGKGRLVHREIMEQLHMEDETVRWSCGDNRCLNPYCFVVDLKGSDDD